MLFDKSKLQEEYCVAFVDILGFKSMTAHGKLIENGPIINEAIENMKNIFSVQIAVVKDGILQIRELNQIDQVYKKIQTLQFADSIALLFPKEPYVSLLAIQRLMSLQFHLLTKGILIRGAICTGEMYIDSEQNIYYGEAQGTMLVGLANIQTMPVAMYGIVLDSSAVQIGAVFALLLIIPSTIMIFLMRKFIGPEAIAGGFKMK